MVVTGHPRDTVSTGRPTTRQQFAAIYAILPISAKFCQDHYPNPIPLRAPEAQAAVLRAVSFQSEVFCLRYKNGALLSSPLPQARSKMAAAVIGSDCVKMDINIANTAELRANAQYVLASTRAARPKNTTLVYGPKQRELKVSYPAS